MRILIISKSRIIQSSISQALEKLIHETACADPGIGHITFKATIRGFRPVAVVFDVSHYPSSPISFLDVLGFNRQKRAYYASLNQESYLITAGVPLTNIVFRSGSMEQDIAAMLTVLSS